MVWKVLGTIIVIGAFVLLIAWAAFGVQVPVPEEWTPADTHTVLVSLLLTYLGERLRRSGEG